MPRHCQNPRCQANIDHTHWQAQYCSLRCRDQARRIRRRMREQGKLEPAQPTLVHTNAELNAAARELLTQPTVESPNQSPNQLTTEPHAPGTPLPPLPPQEHFDRIAQTGGDLERETSEDFVKAFMQGKSDSEQ